MPRAGEPIRRNPLFDSSFDEPPALCAHCKAEYERNRSWQKYCGPECVKEAYVLKRRKLAARKRWRREMSGNPKKCAYCKEWIEGRYLPGRKHFERSDQKYCDDACKQAAYRERKRNARR
jgi:hypothetical protein